MSAMTIEMVDTCIGWLPFKHNLTWLCKQLLSSNLFDKLICFRLTRILNYNIQYYDLPFSPKNFPLE